MAVTVTPVRDDGSLDEDKDGEKQTDLGYSGGRAEWMALSDGSNEAGMSEPHTPSFGSW